MYVLDEPQVPIEVGRAVKECAREVSDLTRRVIEEDLAGECRLPETIGRAPAAKVAALTCGQSLLVDVYDRRVDVEDASRRSENSDQILDLISRQSADGRLMTRAVGTIECAARVCNRHRSA